MKFLARLRGFELGTFGTVAQCSTTWAPAPVTEFSLQEKQLLFSVSRVWIRIPLFEAEEEEEEEVRLFLSCSAEPRRRLGAQL